MTVGGGRFTSVGNSSSPSMISVGVRSKDFRAAGPPTAVARYSGRAAVAGYGSFTRLGLDPGRPRGDDTQRPPAPQVRRVSRTAAGTRRRSREATRAQPQAGAVAG